MKYPPNATSVPTSTTSVISINNRQRREKVDKYNNRPPIKKFVSKISERVDTFMQKYSGAMEANIGSLYNNTPRNNFKDVWMGKNTTPLKAPADYKTSRFFTGFHHTAYLENVHNVQSKLKSNRSRSVSPTLPTIPYLKKNTPTQLITPGQRSAPQNMNQQKCISTVRNNSPKSTVDNVHDCKDNKIITNNVKTPRLVQNDVQFRCKRSTSTINLTQNSTNQNDQSQTQNKTHAAKQAKSEETIKSAKQNDRNEKKPQKNVTEIKGRCCVKKEVPANVKNQSSLKPLNQTIIPKKTLPQHNLMKCLLGNLNLNGKHFPPAAEALSSEKTNTNACATSNVLSATEITLQIHKNLTEIDQAQRSNSKKHIPSTSANANKSRSKYSLSPETNRNPKGETTVKFINSCDPKLHNFVANLIQHKIQYDRQPECVELYRNNNQNFCDNSSSVSKRSSSAPPVRFFPRKCRNPRNVELFNPNFNFVKDGIQNRNSNKSILDSIKARVFNYEENRTAHNESDEWNEDQMKFPKETRNAFLMMMNKKQSQSGCKYRGEKICNNMKTMQTSHTQTTPKDSCVNVNNVNVNINVIQNNTFLTCPKNLLCDRGIHKGKCTKYARERKKVAACKSGCVCREHIRQDLAECFDLHVEVAKKCESKSESHITQASSQETFLKMMEPNGLLNDQTSEQSYLMSNNFHEPLDTELLDITMNGLNGHTNGELNGCGDIITQNQMKGCWTIGLINSKFRYLTAETFGFKINANGASLKKKQIWTLEPDQSNGAESLIYLRSHLDKYLAVDSFGNVTCESDEKDPGCKFQISVSEDGSGRWAFRNVVRGYFLGSSSDKLTCTAKVPGDAEFWHVHLAARPQINLRSIGRKRFAHLSENLDEIHVDANIPWGEDTLFTLEFRSDESGKYAIHTCNNKYLACGGKLVDTCNRDCLFTAEYHSGQLALRDRSGAYLSPIGSKAILKTRSNTVTKDELFSLEDSLPQASFVAALNSKYVSVKQGVDVTANQDEISDHETFQLEFDWSTKRWYIRTMQDKYWTLETGGGIQAVGDKRSSNALFDLTWQGDGSCAFRANNGRYVITKRSGHLYATSDTIDDNCKYFFYLINRPILVLKCEQGFVGYKSGTSPKLECNKATYETIQVERGEKGVVYFKRQNGKYWHSDSEGVTADSDIPEGFYLELREPTRLSIKSVQGNYLTASKNGAFRLGDSSFESATQWEY